MTDSLSFTKDVHNTFRAYGYFWEAWPPLHRQSLLDVIVLGTNICNFRNVIQLSWNDSTGKSQGCFMNQPKSYDDYIRILMKTSLPDWVVDNKENKNYLPDEQMLWFIRQESTWIVESCQFGLSGAVLVESKPRPRVHLTLDGDGDVYHLRANDVLVKSYRRVVFPLAWASG